MNKKNLMAFDIARKAGIKLNKDEAIECAARDIPAGELLEIIREQQKFIVLLFAVKDLPLSGHELAMVKILVALTVNEPLRTDEAMFTLKAIINTHQH